MVARLFHRFGGIVAVIVLWGAAFWILADRYLTPGIAPLWPMPPRANWVTPAVVSDRAYFRRDWDLSAQPSSAWIAVAAEDYRLYVNGKLIGWNAHWFNAGLAFQNKISDQDQSLTVGQVMQIARSPTPFARGNREWSVAQVFEIDRMLRPGRNVIAVYVQDPQGAKVKLWGGAMVPSGPVSLAPAPWKYALVEKTGSDDAWYSSRRVDESWDQAVERTSPEGAISSRVPIAAWSLPFEGALTILRPDEARSAFHIRPVGPFGRSAWLRLYATRGAEIVVDGETILSLPPKHRLWVVDMSDYVDELRRGLEVRLSEEGPSQFAQAPIVAADLVSDDVVVPLVGSGDRSRAASREEILRIGSLRKDVITLRSDFLRQAWTLVRGAFGWMALPTAALIVAWRWRKHLRIDTPADLGARSLAISAPALLVLGGVELLRFRLFETDTQLLFSSDGFRLLVPLVFAGIFVACFLRAFFRPHWNPSIDLTFSDERTVQRAVVLLMLVTALLRVATLSAEPLQADENVSWDAARGILQTGVPRAVSGVLYTRSPLYHYLLAGWLAVFGDSLVSARLFAVPWAVGVTYLAFLIARRITGSAAAALIATTLLALDPLQIGIGGLIRFYQPMQFFSLLSVWLFIRGFLDRERRFQDWFFFAVACGVLTQEVFVTLLPGFCAAFFLYYRPFSWKEDLRIPLGFSLVIMATLVDVATFSLLCLTPHVGVGTTSGSIMQLNLRDIASFSTTFIAGHNRSNVLYALTFFAGMFLVRKQAARERVLLMLLVVMTLAFLTLLVLQVAARYMVSIHPLLVIGAVATLHDLLERLKYAVLRWTERPHFASFLHRVALGGCAGLLAINLEFPKTLGAFESPRVLEHQYALEKIGQLRRPGDKVMSVHPMPGAILFGGVDYYLERGSSFDEVYQRGDRVVDRWAGGQLVSRVTELRDVFEENERVWVVLDEMEKPKLRQAVKTFLYESCAVEFEFKDGQVLLWERGAGRLSKLVHHE